MIPFQQSDEYFTFGTPTTPQGYQIQDLDLSGDNLISFSIGSSNKESSKRNDLQLNRRRRKESRDESSSKKVMHREEEKKRRQEMSNLYSSMRSLLPDDQLKGKRSVCDQMQAAGSHIKRMEKNIQELKNRRDELKSLYNLSSGNGEGSSWVTNMGSNGMEIVISHDIERSDLGFSRVFAELEGSEVDVITSVSTRVKDKFVHKIHVEARDRTDVDVFMLQERLSNAIK